MTAAEVWQRDKIRQVNLLSLNEVNNFIEVFEYDLINDLDVLSPLKKVIYAL